MQEVIEVLVGESASHQNKITPSDGNWHTTDLRVRFIFPLFA